MMKEVPEGCKGYGSGILLDRCVNCEYNPEKGHAGKTLKQSFETQFTEADKERFF